MARFVRDASGIRHVLKDINGPTGRHITALSSQTASTAKARVGVDTTKLRESIGFSVALKGHLVGRIGSDVSYALLHHEGSSAHWIFPNKKKALKFNRGAQVVFAKAVYHPGTKPNRYLTSSLEDVVG